MSINDRIIVKDYKCFGSEGQGFDRILPINIIIGKNNSGKSSLIDLIKFVIKPEISFISTGRNNSKATVIISHPLTADNIQPYFRADTVGGVIGRNHYEYGKGFLNKLYSYQINEKGNQTYLSIDADIIKGTEKQFSQIAQSLERPFKGKIFCHVTAERDITPEADENIDLITNGYPFYFNGRRATNYIQIIITNNKYERGVIEEDLLEALNLILKPDINFNRILIERNDDNLWELIFEDQNKTRIPLSKMGSGIKTILLVLLNLIAKPKIEKRSPSDYVFAFEELENNVHPGLQRRLYEYIINYSEQHSTYFFITTHSNIVIDAFGTYPNAQLIHASFDGIEAKANTIIALDKTKELLKDLGVKASDLLQSNGIIWVEGPSDRIYINKWLSLINPNLREGFHYQIMFYGGRLLSNLTFSYDWLNEEFINLLRINTNAYVIIDRDGRGTTKKLSETKKRIQNEIGEGYCWITIGWEIENYLSARTINSWLESKLIKKREFKFDKFERLEEGISKIVSGKHNKYNLDKKKYSLEIIDHITLSDIKILDLEERIFSLENTIKQWNSID